MQLRTAIVQRRSTYRKFAESSQRRLLPDILRQKSWPNIRISLLRNAVEEEIDGERNKKA
jgi:hypothetical protein